MKRSLIIFISIIVVLLSISCTNIQRALPVKLTNHYIITDVNVVDVINKTIRLNQDLTIKYGVIDSINPHLKDNLQFNGDITTRIDGSGKYLIPGLWDNHSTILKTSPELDFPLYIANGVTSVRSNLSCPNEQKTSIYACMKDKMEWSKAIASADMVGPTIQGWGTFPVNGSDGTGKVHPDLPIFHGAGTVKQAQQVVEHYAKYTKTQRPFFIKTYNWLMPEQYAELSRYAKLHGFELSGHMPRSLNLTDVVDAGQRSIAHARLFMFDCSKLSAELQAGKYKKRPLPQQYRLLIDTFDEQGCQRKYEYLAVNNVFLNPTLMTRRNDYYVVADRLDDIQGLEYVHYLFMMEFEEDSAKLGINLSADDVRAYEEFYLLSAHTIAQAQKAGVKILAGTDSWNEYVVPGFSLHEELQALAEAGLDNYAVLQAATINGAKYFRVEDKVGSLNIGKQANMVLLNANPIENVKNVQKINTVFKGQQIFKTKKLEQLKSDVKKLSKSHIVTLKLLRMLLQNPHGL